MKYESYFLDISDSVALVVFYDSGYDCISGVLVQYAWIRKPMIRSRNNINILLRWALGLSVI